MNVYIKRELHDQLVQKIRQSSIGGYILSGIVGSGKTTLVQEIIKDLKEEFEVFEFSGDDV